MTLQEDADKVKAGEQAALGWYARNPKLGGLALLVLGLIVGAIASCIHLHK